MDTARLPRSRTAVLVPTVATLAVAAAACRSEVTGPPDLALATERAEYAAGDTVRVTLTNRGARAIEYGCEAGLVDLERQAGAAWRTVSGAPRAANCAAMAFVVRPGESARLTTVPLPSGLAAGAYRVRFPRFSGRASNTFRLR